MSLFSIDFNNKKASNEDKYYDLREDWSLIESSFASQYSIRLRNEHDMKWTEFVSLLNGILPSTALGNIVSIRAEKDSKVIKNFTPSQKRIHREWKIRKIKNGEYDKEEFDKQMDSLSKMLNTVFGKNGGVSNGISKK